MAFKLFISSVYNSGFQLTRQLFRKHENVSRILVSNQFSSSASPDIATYDEIKNLTQSTKSPKILLIDVREPQELQDTGIVPTSINIPLGQVKEKLSSDFSDEEFKRLFNREKPSVDAELIFMCKIGVRSQKAADLAKTLGFAKSRNFLGSWTEWSEKEGLVKK